VAGLGGALLAAARNRLDGWYVLVSLGILLVWYFGEDNMRRLLYPLVPLLLVHAAELVVFIAVRAKLRHPGRVLLAVAALAALMCAPAFVLLLDKSGDRAPVAPGFPYALADMTDYYTTIELPRAQALAAMDIAVLSGLRALERDTPTGSRIMWVRPEYVALLGRREGVPWYFGWDERALAAAIRESKADYVAVSSVLKTDLRGSQSGGPVTRSMAARFAHPVFHSRNAVTGNVEFVLLQVDAAGLEEFLKATR
jgi:hypothetical protein